MREEIEAYVKTCLTCQQDKVEQQAPAGLLVPLPVADHPWASVSLDFISALPKSEEYGSILVVVDRFSKFGTFIPCPRDCTAEQAARLFFKNVVKLWGLPQNIVSDRDPRFTGKLWRELFRIMGTQLHFSTSFHPQSDGQTERVNSLVECYLRHFVGANQKDWAKLLDVAQFSYNLQRSESTGRSPCEIVMGRQPTTPHTLEKAEQQGPSPAATQMAQTWQDLLNLTRAQLAKTQRRMKKWADKKRRPVEYNVGDRVLVKLLPQQFKALRKLHKGLLRKYEGPFPILSRVGKVSYKLELPATLRIHNVFHVSMLKPYHEDMTAPERGVSHRAPPIVTTAYDRQAEAVLGHRILRRRGIPPTPQYLIHWKGLPLVEATWETEADLWQFHKLIRAYLATRASANPVGEDVTTLSGEASDTARLTATQSEAGPTATLPANGQQPSLWPNQQAGYQQSTNGQQPSLRPNQNAGYQ